MSKRKEKKSLSQELEEFGSGKLPVETSSFEGLLVNTQIAMEPGEDYGNKHGDFYQVDATGIAIYKEHMTFSSFEQLVEFRNHLSEYIAGVVRKATAEMDYINKKCDFDPDEEIEDLE